MLAKRIIPCLDVDAGRVVKGVNFVGIRDAGDPVEVACRYNDEGADEITILDITASSDHRNTIVDVIEDVASNVFIPLTVGGGIRELDDIKRVLDAGADKVSINTAAVFVLNLSVRRVVITAANVLLLLSMQKRVEAATESGWEIFTHGGRRSTGIDAVDWARKMTEFGAGELLVTSMDRDGCRDGFDNELNAKISSSVAVPVIASGGVGNLDHLADGVIFGLADAVLAASIFHFGEYTISEAKEHMQKRGIEVNL